MRSWLIGFFILVLFPALSFAGAVITFHGRILDPADRPVEGSGVTFKIRVYSPSPGKCLLYEETRTINMTGTAGVFAIPIGDGSGSRTVADPGVVMEKVFSNDPNLTHSGVVNPKITCNSGSSYTPQALDQRQLFVSFDDATGAGEQLLPVMDVNFVPFAVSSYDAQNVGGTPANSVVRVSGGIASPLTPANFTELLNLLSGTSAQYSKANQLSGSNVPTLSNGQVLGWSGSGWTAMTPSTDLALSDATTTTKGIVQIAPTGGMSIASGVLSLPNTGTPGTYYKVTTDAKGRVASGSALLVESDIPTLSTAGKVSGGAITSGTIGGSTNISTSGTVSADQVSTRGLYLSNTQPKTISVLPPAAITPVGGYSLTLPQDVGANGALLSTSGSGVLTWTDPSSIIPADKWATNANGIDYSSGNVGIGTTSPSGRLHSVDSTYAGTALFERSGQTTDGVFAAARVKATKTTDMADGFGSGVGFTVQDDAGVENSLGLIGAVRAGADATGDLVFRPSVAGSGQERMRITSSGNVGIGTTNPATKLHVSGDVLIDNNKSFKMWNAASSASAGTLGATGANNISLSAVTNDLYLSTNSAASIVFSTTNTERARIDSSGNVGIGKASPAYKLDVAGDVNVTGNFKVNGVNIAAGGGSVTSVTSANSDITVTTTTTTPVLTLNSGTGANQIAKLDGAGKLPASTLPSSALTTSSTLSGDVSGTSSTTIVDKIKGTAVSATTPSTAGQVLRYSGSQWVPNFVSMADLRSTITGASALVSCANNQTLTWSAATDNLACSNISLPTSQLSGSVAVANGGTGASSTSQGYVFAGPTSGSGAPSFRAIASTDLPSGTLSGSGSAGYVPYYSAASTLANSVIYQSGGSVGIGTTNPSTSLDVRGANVPLIVSSSNSNLYKIGLYDNGTARGWVGADATKAFAVGNSAGSTSSLLTVLDTGNVGIGTTDPAVKLQVTNSSGMGALMLGDNTAGNNHHLVHESSDSSFRIYDDVYGSGTTRFMISASGNVGIGTSYASRPLDVVGDARLRSNIELSTLGAGIGFNKSFSSGGSSYDGTNYNWSIAQETSAPGGLAIKSYFTAGATYSQPLYLHPNGNVGIGTTSPSQLLHLSSSNTSATYIELTNTSTSGRDWLIGSTGSANGQGVGRLAFWDNTAGLSRMVIDPSGNVGIGTTNPLKTLHISNGNTSGLGAQTSVQIGDVGTGMGPLFLTHNSPEIAGNAYYNAGDLYGGGAGKPSKIDLVNGVHFSTSNNAVGAAGTAIMDLTEKMTIAPSGNVGIGTTSPGTKLQVGVNADGSVALANAWNTFSDARLKDVEGRIPNACQMVDQLNGYYYTWKSGADRSRQVGVLAQEVEAVLPELVKETSEGVKTVDYSKLTAVLIEANKEHSREIASVKADNATKDQKIQKLEQDNAAMKAWICTKDPKAVICK